MNSDDDCRVGERSVAAGVSTVDEALAAVAGADEDATGTKVAFDVRSLGGFQCLLSVRVPLLHRAALAVFQRSTLRAGVASLTLLKLLLLGEFGFDFQSPEGASDDRLAGLWILEREHLTHQSLEAFRTQPFRGFRIGGVFKHRTA